MGSFTVLVIDDYAPLRQMVSSILEEMPDVQVIGEGGDGLEAVQKTEELHPDLIILDIGLPKMNGFEAARKIISTTPAPKIIFLSQDTSKEMAAEALRLGAVGYVVKVNAATDLPRAVESVRKREAQAVARSLK
jgi:DNA-binding NarL/FixJ family response regulator